MKEISSKII